MVETAQTIELRYFHDNFLLAKCSNRVRVEVSTTGSVRLGSGLYAGFLIAQRWNAEHFAENANLLSPRIRPTEIDPAPYAPDLWHRTVPYPIVPCRIRCERILRSILTCSVHVAALAFSCSHYTRNHGCEKGPHVTWGPCRFLPFPPPFPSRSPVIICPLPAVAPTLLSLIHI